MKHSDTRRLGYCATLATLSCVLALQAMGMEQADTTLQFTRLGTQSIRAVNSIEVTGTSIVLATSDDLYLSRDEGVSWSSVSHALPYAYYVNVIPSGDTVVAVAKTGKVFRTTNHGFTWHLIPDAGERIQATVSDLGRNLNWTVTRRDTSLTISHFTGAVAELSSMSFSSLADIVVADDEVYLSNRRAGVSTVTLPSLQIQQLDLGELAGEYVNKIAVHAGHLYVAVGSTTRNIYRRRLNGIGWELIQPDRNLFNVEVVKFATSGLGVYVASREHGVLFIANNSHVIKSISNGLHGSIIESITPIHRGLLVCGRLLGAFVLNTDTTELIPLRGVQGIGTEYIAAALGTCMVVSTNKNWVMRSLDGGQTWKRSDSVLPNLAIESISAYGSKFYAATSRGAWVSSDSGASWRILDPRLNNERLSKVISHDSVTICIATSGTILLRPDGTIERFSPGIDSNTQTRLADAIFHNDTIYAPGFPGLYISGDYGRTWRLHRLPKVANVRAAAILGGRIIVSVDSGELLICRLP